MTDYPEFEIQFVRTVVLTGSIVVDTARTIDEARAKASDLVEHIQETTCVQYQVEQCSGRAVPIVKKWHKTQDDMVYCVKVV